MAWRRREGIDDPRLLELFERSGANVERSCVLLRDLLHEYPERSELARTLVDYEHEGDRITHDIIHRLNGENGATPSSMAPDWHALATALDDIVDYAEETADALGLYGIEAPMAQAEELAEVLSAAGAEVARALKTLREGASVASHLVEIHRLENAGDRLLRSGVAALFAGGIDPMIVIRWKDIYDSLEQAIDACETVAHILEGLELKRRARR